METIGCQATDCSQLNQVIRRTLTLALSLIIAGNIFFLCSAAGEARHKNKNDLKNDLKDDLPDKLFSGTTVPESAPALAQAMTPTHGGPITTNDNPPPDGKLISPPGEEPYFPVRADGQPYILNVDMTVNLTATLNHFYWDPRWRGEVWSPWDAAELPERAQRVMSTWPEYDEANTFRFLSGVNQTIERYSGFGPQ